MADASVTVTSRRHPAVVTDGVDVTKANRHSVTGTVTPASVTRDATVTASPATTDADASVTRHHRHPATVTNPRSTAMTVTVTRDTKPAVTVIDVEPTSVTDRRIPTPRQGLRGDMSLDQFLTYYVITLAAAGTAGYGLYQYLV